MSIVADILTQTKAVCASTLGNSYQELRYVFDVSQNDPRCARLAYSVRPMSGLSTAGVTRVYTLDQGFEIVLTDTVARAESDAEKTTALGVMYDKADQIFKALVNTKINLPSTVLLVFDPSLSEPEFLNDQKIIVLRMQIKVKYRSALT